MQKFTALSVIAFVTVSAASADTLTIPPSAARSHIGQRVTAQGLVSNAYFQGSGATVIEMGGEGGFNAIYYSDAMDVYPDAVSLSGKTVSISGTLQMDEDRPEIIIRSPAQIKIGR